MTALGSGNNVFHFVSLLSRDDVLFTVTTQLIYPRTRKTTRMLLSYVGRSCNVWQSRGWSPVNRNVETAVGRQVSK